MAAIQLKKNKMEDHQFEEITAALSVIICLLAWEFGATYLFYAYLVKATWDTFCAVRASIKAANADIKKEKEEQNEHRTRNI